MAKDLCRELKRLKKDYYDLEEKGREEKEALIRVINTFGVIASTQEDVAEDIKEMKDLLNTEDELQTALNNGVADYIAANDIEEFRHNGQQDLAEAISAYRSATEKPEKNIPALVSELERLKERTQPYRDLQDVLSNLTSSFVTSGAVIDKDCVDDYIETLEADLNGDFTEAKRDKAIEGLKKLIMKNLKTIGNH